MTVEKTKDIDPGKNIVMVVYSRGGVGKTTFGASAPNAIVFDFENGTKYLGERGINVDVVRMNKWFSTDEKNQLPGMVKNYDSIVIDPLGEAMDKLIDSAEINGKKYRATDGSPTMAGWGEIKKQMRNFIKWLRGTGKNVILVAHENEIQTEEGLTHRIQVATKLSEEIPNMVDVISYMAVRKDENGMQRLLYTPQQGGSFDSKDRLGKIPEVVEVSELNGWNDFLDSMKGDK
jgi:phage nucleotide-binding protein